MTLLEYSLVIQYYCYVTVCSFADGWPYGVTYNNLSLAQNENECANLVKNTSTAAKGASFQRNDKTCWAIFGESISTDTSSVYEDFRFCFFEGIMAMRVYFNILRTNLL